MKKSLVLTGLVSVLLMAGLMFTACPGEPESDPSPPSVTAPAADQLPDLPSDEGIAPVATEDEAKALLEALTNSGLVRTLKDQVQVVLEKEADNNETTTETGSKGEWKITNDESLVDGLKISSSGIFSESTNNAEGDDMKKGDYSQRSDSQDFAIVVTKDLTPGSVTLIKGSTIDRAQSDTGRQEVTAVSGEKTTFNYSLLNQDAYALGLTVTHNGKAGKIILEASGKASGSGTVTTGTDDNVLPTITASGSLKVYGSDDTTPVYSLTVTKQTYEEILGYFGLKFDFQGKYDD